MAISQPDLIKQCDFCFYALISLYHGKFPDLLKLLYVFPVYKAKDSLDKTTLFRLLQSWGKVSDNSGYFSTVLMDLPKAYVCTPYDLLIAKLETYGLDKTSLHLLEVQSCKLNNNKYMITSKQITNTGVFTFICTSF